MRSILDALATDRLGLAGLVLFGIFLALALIAPIAAPYDPMALNYHPDGSLVRMEPPSREHWLGTTRMGRDVLSQLLMGTRPALFVGVVSAVFVVGIGTHVGLVAGYFGGWVDDLLMRITDLTYGIPFLPFALILAAILGPGIQNMIIAIALVSWRGTARVIRSQTMSLRNRPFVEAARVAGAGHWRIIYRHLLPNVAPLALVYLALTMGWAIMTEASLSFLGYGDPRLVSWGKMLYDCYSSQAMFSAWWWMVPPGLAIALLVLSGFLMGRSYEQIADPRLVQ